MNMNSNDYDWKKFLKKPCLRVMDQYWYPLLKITVLNYKYCTSINLHTHYLLKYKSYLALRLIWFLNYKTSKSITSSICWLAGKPQSSSLLLKQQNHRSFKLIWGNRIFFLLAIYRWYKKIYVSRIITLILIQIEILWFLLFTYTRQSGIYFKNINLKELKF